MTRTFAQDNDFYHSLPKVDLHRHLEGSLRLGTLTELARSMGMAVTGTGPLRALVQIREEEPYTFENFLSKFDTLRLFYRSPEIISRVTREAIIDAAKDNVRYLELRFTPVALSKAEGFPLSEVIDWVIEGREQALKEADIQVSLIASVNRHESPQLAEQVIGLAVERRSQGIVGIDLAGNEARFSALPFAPIFQQARKEGLHITVHAGEWAGSPNVAEAIEKLGAERIGHGIRVLEDPSVVHLAHERGTVFEVCITSNHQSGVVPTLSKHPLPRLLSANLKATLNTDDPSIEQTTLSNEYKLASEDLGLSVNILYDLILAGVSAAFLPDLTKNRLAQALQEELAPRP